MAHLKIEHPTPYVCKAEIRPWADTALQPRGAQPAYQLLTTSTKTGTKKEEKRYLEIGAIRGFTFWMGKWNVFHMHLH